MRNFVVHSTTLVAAFVVQFAVIAIVFVVP